MKYLSGERNPRCRRHRESIGLSYSWYKRRTYNRWLYRRRRHAPLLLACALSISQNWQYIIDEDLNRPTQPAYEYMRRLANEREIRPAWLTGASHHVMNKTASYRLTEAIYCTVSVNVSVRQTDMAEINLRHDCIIADSTANHFQTNWFN